MTRKEGWEGSSTGPDWIDCEMLMRAIGGVHSGHVAVIISPGGIGSTGGVDVVGSIILDVLPGSSIPETIQRMAGWPCSTHTTLAAHVFGVLHELDHAISETYKNEELWK